VGAKKTLHTKTSICERKEKEIAQEKKEKKERKKERKKKTYKGGQKTHNRSRQVGERRYTIPEQH